MGYRGCWRLGAEKSGLDGSRVPREVGLPTLGIGWPTPGRSVTGVACASSGTDDAGRSSWRVALYWLCPACPLLTLPGVPTSAGYLFLLSWQQVIISSAVRWGTRTRNSVSRAR